MIYKNNLKMLCLLQFLYTVFFLLCFSKSSSSYLLQAYLYIFPAYLRSLRYKIYVVITIF